MRIYDRRFVEARFLPWRRDPVALRWVLTAVCTAEVTSMPENICFHNILHVSHWGLYVWYSQQDLICRDGQILCCRNDVKTLGDTSALCEQRANW